MKTIKQLIFLASLLLVVFVFVPSATAYEQDQLADCVSSAMGNASIEGASESSIKNFCDCALELILDQSKDVRESGYECAVKNFG